jgi:SAM-dependent methyltransferase
MTSAVERVDRDLDAHSWAEHRSRYHFAAAHINGGRVLDVACGTGYGCTLLLEAGADSVVGVDSSSDALAAASGARRPELELIRADARTLPLPDGSIDLTVSFETIEHLEEGERFVAELRRVTAPDGVLVISTPNALHARRLSSGGPNPFHVREYEPNEFEALLRTRFDDVRLLGQRPHPRFRPCPYWESQPPSSPRERGAVLVWKVHRRLPSPVRDPLARALGRPTFMPGEHDFVFDPDGVSSAHALVGVCSG